MKAIHDVVIVGGGAGGKTVASLLARSSVPLKIAIVEPSEHHFYQPAWTLVGAGHYPIAQTRRRTADLVASGVDWIQKKVAAFRPDENTVDLDDGSSLQYRYLVVAAGLQLDWHKIAGLTEALGHDEILYMAADYFRRHGVKADLSFLLPGAAMFGVPFYSKALDRVVAEYGITPCFSHELIRVDGARKTATFQVVRGDAKERVELAYDLLHVVPPQSAHDFLKASPLADPTGWVTVDKQTLRHTLFANIFGLGDCTNTPNSKTAAAVRAQAPVMVANLLAVLDGKEMMRRYDGYASCPLPTSIGRIMLAEFCYNGAITPSLPMDPRIPRRTNWLLKRYYLPKLYWRMVKGSTGPDLHRKRSFPEAVPTFHA